MISLRLLYFRLLRFISELDGIHFNKKTKIRSDLTTIIINQNSTLMKRTIITLFSFLLAFTAMAAQDIMSMSVKGQWVWVTSTSQYVIGYNMETGEKRLYRFTDTALTPSYFTAVAEKDDGTILLGTSRDGMYALYPDNTCKVYTTKGTSIDEIITSGEDAWYISKSYIRKITDNLETMEWKCAIDFVSYSDIYDITLDKKGRLWISEACYGLCKLENNEMTYVEEKRYNIDHTSGVMYGSIAVDENNGCVYNASRISGNLYRYDIAKDTTFLVESLPFSVAFMCLDQDGSIWIANNNNIAKRTDSGYVSFEPDGNPTIKCMQADSYGHIWFGTKDGCLLKFDGNTFTRIHLFDEESSIENARTTASSFSVTADRSSELITLCLPDRNTVTDIEIYDASGHLIQTIRNSATATEDCILTVNGNTLPHNQFYIIKVRCKEATYTDKFIW
jgi:streptogramin lyase